MCHDGVAIAAPFVREREPWPRWHIHAPLSSAGFAGGTSTRNDAGRTLQLPLRQLTEGVGNGAAGVEGDRGVADGFPAETVTDRVDGAVREEVRHSSPGARAP